MSDLTLLGPWVRRFLLEHLVAERNLARNTQCSYRDALTLLIPFVADKLHRSVDRLTLVDVSADLVRVVISLWAEGIAPTYTGNSSSQDRV